MLINRQTYPTLAIQFNFLKFIPTNINPTKLKITHKKNKVSIIIHLLLSYLETPRFFIL